MSPQTEILRTDAATRHLYGVDMVFEKVYAISEYIIFYTKEKFL